MNIYMIQGHNFTLTLRWPRGGGSYGPNIFFCMVYYFRLHFFDRYFFLIVLLSEMPLYSCLLALLHNIKKLFWPPFWNGINFFKCYFSNVNLFMFPTLSQISLKNSFGKVVFQILAKIEMTRNKNWLFGRRFETVKHFEIFVQNYDFLQCLHIWCKFYCKIPVEKCFSGGFFLGTNRSKSTLVT